VTSGARPSASGAKPADLVLAGIVREVVELGAGHGITRDALLAELALRADELEDPDALVPFEAYVRAWEILDAIPGNQELGLRLGAAPAIEQLGALGFVLLHAQTGVDAARSFRRFSRLVSESLAPQVDLDDEHLSYHLVWPPRLARIVACADYALVSPIKLFRSLAGLPDDFPLAVEAWYQCQAPAGLDRAQVLGCRVRYGAPEMRLVLRREPLERPLPRRDPALFAYLTRHTEALLARVPGSTRLSDGVRRVICETLRLGEPDQAEVCRKLAVSERTLQRRLREEGTSFAQILEQVRHASALQYLQNPELTLHETAFLLGYSEPSAFHRAFRRWEGETPQVFRRRVRGA
jgi:AraC-like DNA-binding protein